MRTSDLQTDVLRRHTLATAVTATGGSGFAHGAQIQQCYELGGPFEDLIDHPSFFGKICRFLGPEAGGTGDSGWDNHPHGLPTIDEAFVNFRSEGGAISMHGEWG